MPLNRPTQAELLEALGDYLKTPPADLKLDGFLRRVAANVAGVCQREAQQGADYRAADQAFQQRLMQLTGADSLAALCQCLADGEQDVHPLLSDWLQLAEKKLAIDNPRYPRG